MKETLNWGVVGTGGIATDFANALTRSKRCRIVNVSGLTPELTPAFADKWRIPTTAASLDELLADKAVEAVYIATPHPFHEQMAMAAIAAGKPVLCEKPIALDAEASAKVIDAARKKGVFLMEGYMYRGHPLMREVVKRLQEGVIGTIRHVRADFAFRVPRDPEGRLFATKLGGGGILDVGGYVVSFARLVAGIVEGVPFAEPYRARRQRRHRPPRGGRDDDRAPDVQVRHDRGGAPRPCSTTRAPYGVVFGDEGKLVMPDPWIPQQQAPVPRDQLHHLPRRPRARDGTDQDRNGNLRDRG